MNNKEITVENVNSSDLSWMKWNEAGILEVKFQGSDCVYTYTDVPKAYWNGLYSRNGKRDLKNPATDKYSVGKYFHKTVIADAKKGILKESKDCPKSKEGK